jgi:conjugative transfer signal peptidase TraF
MPRLNAFRGLFVGLFVTGLVAVPATFFARPLLIYNATDSLPHGLYFVVHKALYRRDELVVFPIPASVRELVRQRRWLPDGAFLIKPIAGKSGDLFDTKNGRCLINAKAFGPVKTVDRTGRKLPVCSVSRRLETDEVAVLNPACCSFDSRYFGPIRERDIIGAARPIWIWERTTREPQAARTEQPVQGMGKVRNRTGMGSAR